MPPTLPPMKPGPGHGLMKSRSANDRNDESVYNIGANAMNMGIPPAAPKVRTYIVTPPAAPGQQAIPAAGRGRTHEDSSQIKNLLNPVQGPRDAMARQGIKPFDHAKSNVMAVKEASKMNALRKQAEEISQAVEGGPRPAYVRSNSVPRQAYGSPGGMSAEDRRNFLQENKMNAGVIARMKPDKKEEEPGKYLKKKDFGRVPSYLLDRKIELAEQAEAAARAKEAALIPPGMRVMPEEERLETLAILEKNRRDVERALQGMPIIIETPSAIRRKDELERRLREIEDAQKIFSRPKVLVQA